MIGGICEFVGLATVALGISETRRAFTDRPSIVGRALASAKRLMDRVLRKPQGQVIEGVGTLGGVATLEGDGTGLLGDWDNVEPEVRIERLKAYVNRLSEEVDELRRQVKREVAERNKADDLERQERRGLERELKELVQEAAAGGLRLETWGVVFFGIGIVLAGVGSGIG